MLLFIKKLHVIATFIALGSIATTMLLVFLYNIDRTLRWDILPQSWEAPVLFLSWAIGILAFGMTCVSVVLSLYRRVEE